MKLLAAMPIKLAQQLPQYSIALPDGTSVQPPAWDNQPTPMQLTLVRGQCWQAILESGKAKNLSEVAELVGMDRA